MPTRPSLLELSSVSRSAVSTHDARPAARTAWCTHRSPMPTVAAMLARVGASASIAIPATPRTRKPLQCVPYSSSGW
eukprot:scaffold293_cov121-Isochrysis_galbana.AAC.6